MRSRLWDVQGLKIHACFDDHAADAHAGTPPVVLVHGMGASHRYMMPVAAELARFLPVYVPDLPGFGLSDKPREALDIPQLADVLGDWISAAGLEKPVLVGNSMGCQIIVDLAARRPGLLSAAVLQGPTTNPKYRGVWSQFWRLFINGRHEPKGGLGRILISDYLDCGIPRFVRTVRFTLADRVELKLPKVSIPTLVVIGSHDTAVTVDWAHTVARLLPHGRLVVVPNAAHAMNYSFPRELRHVTLEFLRQIRLFHHAPLLRRAG